MTQRIYHGPPRKINDQPRTEEEVRSHRGMPGGKSYADRLTDAYGEEGTGWEFDKGAYSVTNELEQIDMAMRHKLAREALKNHDQGLGMKTDDGVALSSRKIDDYTRTALPPDGDIVVYPDGDHHAQEKRGDR